MRLPRDLSGAALARLLAKKYGCRVTRQTGSHIRITIAVKGESHITLPKHKSIRVGTLNNVLSDIADHLEISKRSLVRELFGDEK